MKQKLQVWWVPQVPMTPFRIDVESVREGVKIMDTLADYDKFQLKHKIKGDYCNVGTLMMLDPDDKEDGQDGTWLEWWDPITGEDNPRAFVRDAPSGLEPYESAPIGEAVLLVWPEWKHYEDGIVYVDEATDTGSRYCVLFDGESLTTPPKYWAKLPCPMEELK